jgi:hypothetical protein
VGDPAAFEVKAEVLSRYSPQTRASVERLIAARRTDTGFLEYAHGWNALEDAVGGFIHEALHLHTAELVAGSLVETLSAKHLLSLAFLRQLPSIEDGSRACYQAIAESPFDVTRFGNGGFLAGKYELEILKRDSSPIASELGFAASNSDGDARISPHIGYYLDFDFRLDAGQTIWEA